MKTGRVDFGGVSRSVSLAYVPEAEVGDWVVVHVGLAISIIDEAEAHKTLALIRELDAEALAEAALPPSAADA